MKKIPHKFWVDGVKAFPRVFDNLLRWDPLQTSPQKEKEKEKKPSIEREKSSFHQTIDLAGLIDDKV
jgi:hypothetical protein